jgi:hypothetical protein
VLTPWHVGIALNKIAGGWRGAFEPRQLWTAWDRGAATGVDLARPPAAIFGPQPNGQWRNCGASMAYRRPTPWVA